MDIISESAAKNFLLKSENFSLNLRKVWKLTDFPRRVISQKDPIYMHSQVLTLIIVKFIFLQKNIVQFFHHQLNWHPLTLEQQKKSWTFLITSEFS